jgi:LemA protein
MNRKTLWIVLGVIAIVLIGWLISSYNSFVSAHLGVNQSWAQVETQYQRRSDLVPNLVSTVKGSANFERETLTDVTNARSAWAQANQVGNRTDMISAAQGFDSALSRLLVTVEAYPQLRSTQAFTDLMAQLEGTENRIAVARKDYNDSATHYNTRVSMFPGILLARMFGFQPEPLFQSTSGAENAPQVQF